MASALRLLELIYSEDDVGAGAVTTAHTRLPPGTAMAEPSDGSVGGLLAAYRAGRTARWVAVPPIPPGFSAAACSSLCCVPAASCRCQRLGRHGGCRRRLGASVRRRYARRAAAREQLRHDPAHTNAKQAPLVATKCPLRQLRQLRPTRSPSHRTRVTPRLAQCWRGAPSP